MQILLAHFPVEAAADLDEVGNLDVGPELEVLDGGKVGVV